MKKINWTNNTDIRLGFEIECVIKRDGYRAFCKKLRVLHPKMVLGQDWSIRTYGCGFWGDFGQPAELKTPPLPPKDAMDLLKKVFDLVNQHGATNASCGFHVNISSAKKSKMNNFNPLPFLSSKLWNEILRKFKREHNGYCKSVLKFRNNRRPSRVRLLKRMTSSLDNKYWAVSLSNFRDNHPASRVEIRAFGNRHYTQKFDLIASYIKRIERLFELSCKAGDAFTRTFAV
jgi:hypothetical protein